MLALARVADAGGLAPASLRTEYRFDPMGIDEPRPRLSWIVESEERGQIQTAWHVLVAGSPAILAEDRGDLWDSGRVEGDEAAAVVYAGAPLRSGTLCHWKVAVWDRDGNRSAWSRPALWSMGLLEASDWKAQWIGHDAPALAAPASGGTLRLPPPRYLRHGFLLERAPRRATVHVSAQGLYELHLNGRRVGDDRLAPGWTDYDRRVYYRTYDVTPLLSRGANAIGAVLADGWYAGYVGFGGGRDLYGDRIRLLAQLDVELDDGTRVTVATGPGWKGSTGPLLEADLLMGERYDSRLEQPGWDAPGFDDSAWHPVDVTPRIGARLQAHPGPPVRELPPVDPVSVTEPQPGRYVFDLGQNFAGVVRLTVAGRSGDVITLRHAEALDPDGTVYTANLRSARATDTYVCRGGGPETWQPAFTFHGFRYVEVTGLPGGSLRAVTGIPLTSDTPAAGSFRCSEEMLERLFSNIRWTQYANFIDVPTDCPQRDERLGWTGDAQAYAATACMVADVQAFFTKWLIDLADAQRADGQFPMVAPLRSRGVSADGGPAWADAGVICPWTIYEVYGDRRLLERHYGSMRRFVDFCTKRSAPDLLPPAEFHCFGDWLNVGAETPHDVIFMAYFARSTDLTARAARALGREAEAAELEALHERIRASFNRAFVGADGRVKGDTQTGQVLALRFGLVEGALRDAAARYLVADIERRGWRLSTGFVGTKDLLPVLSEIGRDDVAWRLLLGRDFPSWGYTIGHGATTIWERWDGWTPEKGFNDPGMNSFAHYAFGAVGEWMFGAIGGIATDGPGFKRIVVNPRPGGGLRWARVRYRSIRGAIESAWTVDGGSLTLEVTIPANTTAVVHVPARDAALVTESGRPAAQAEWVRFLRAAEGRAVYEVGSGRYSFAAPWGP